MNATEWSIQDLAKAAGTTSRTLRHYGELGLLTPSRVGANGYRYYDAAALVRLQRILLLRDLGLGLSAIAGVLEGERDTSAALRTHLRVLEHEQARLARQIASVRTTLRKTEGGEDLMAEEVFDGFDHTQYKDEVVERWGQEAYDSGDAWWRTLPGADKQGFLQQQLDIATEFGAAKTAGLAPDSEQVQAIAARHYEWVAIGWQGRRPTREAFAGLGEMYVADPRFAANYDRHAAGGAEFVRDAMQVYAGRNL
ncbi:MAG TPA: MerR family transcriptional regulator [Mycobacteriales bacterium]|nr:MerR family transcriptional regulator [Mycobacteriales bacterium]